MNRIYVLNLVYLLLLIGSFVLPRLYKDPSGGMAAAATGVLIFFFIFALAGIVASYLFMYTYRRRQDLPGKIVALGLAPFALSILACLTLMLLLRYQ